MYTFKLNFDAFEQGPTREMGLMMKVTFRTHHSREDVIELSRVPMAKLWTAKSLVGTPHSVSQALGPLGKLWCCSYSARTPDL